MSVEIDSHDVIKLMLQFLKENNLMNTLNTLQTETGISLNTVDNVDNFLTDIHMGRWDSVLSQVSSLQLPKEKLMALYEQVVLELLEARENDLAKELLRTTEPLQLLKLEYADRYAKLEHLCLRPVFVTSDAYEMNSSKDKRRREIAESLVSEVSVATPSRLMTLIGQALRFQQAQGLLPKDGTFDLFRGVKRSVRRDNEDLLPKREAGHIKFNPESHPETVLFSPDNLSLATGSVDGFIEIWDYDTCRLRKDLEYQAKEELMMHEDEPIICSTFNREGELLATGGRDGRVKVWKVSTGVCLRKFTKAHSQGITSLCFSRDSTHLLTGSFDTLARVHGMKSGKILKELRGHTSIVNTALYTKDNSHIVTGSADGTVRLWDSRTTECLLNFRPSLSAGSLSSTLSREASVHTIQLIPNNPDLLLICTKTPQAFITTTHGQVVKVFSSGKTTGGDFVCATLSPQGKWLYCVGEDGVLYMFDYESGQLESILEIAEREVIGISHHPNRNLIATITDNGELRLWRP